ncbi:MAG: nucleoside kinase [Oscillospiraceae bacterium]|nr:nucleoside kinase [Oscillospiraceae bacterium]
MTYSIERINAAIRSDPEDFIAKGEKAYRAKIDETAELICGNLENSPIVLLSGPSGSGKTTTAMKICDALKAKGVNSHTVSLDNYFKTVNPRTAPRTPEGEIDYESPLHLDMDLLNEHFTMLTRGEEIRVPYFIFSRQKRSSTQFTPLKLAKNEVAIFEGIHALNDAMTEKHPEAFKLYISASSQFAVGAKIVFLRTWLRLVRRIVRDNNFRGASAEDTITMWGDVLRGEILYIDPYKYKSDHHIDTALPYEVSVMKNIAVPLLEKLPEGVAREDELHEMLSAFASFEPLDEALIPRESMLREFIGGGIYSY